MKKMHCLIFPIGYLFLTFTLSCCLGMNMNARNITTDQYALLDWKNHMIAFDSNQTLSKNWSVDSPVCSWIGVTCGSRHHRVTALNVSFMGLSGAISPQLGNLSFLISLDITGNKFHGELPTELSRLQRLRVLNLSNNSFSGGIPSWFGSLHELQFLSLKKNSFNGSIPTSIYNLSNLDYLSLSFNCLQGSIPDGIGNLRNLKTLVIESAGISGTFPDEMLNISSLETIALRNNNLSGSLPMFPCNRLRKLTRLNLSSNKFNGEIPSGLFQCLELQILSLSGNKFGGFIPKDIGSFKALEYLFLGQNNFQGEIPREIGNLTMLRTLSIVRNNLSGVIPREFGNLYNLEKLSLSNNSLSGSIPVEIFNLSAISLIDLGANNLSERLPSRMCQSLSNLTKLYLYWNNLPGVLPESISNCSKLDEIELDGNRLVGSIPNSLGNLRLLKWLDLADNSLSGNRFPLELGFVTFLTNCKSLRVLQVQNNPLNGHLPESVGNFSTSLEEFSASNCDIQDKIPKGFGNLSSLFQLDLSDNILTGSIPETVNYMQHLQILDLQGNYLNKARLDKLCLLPKLSALYLSRNQILESIPECLGNLTFLRHLYLDSNRLTSSIPARLFNLKDLLELNLSSNSLTGFLPPEVGNLKILSLIDLSINNLSSVIPFTIGYLQEWNYLSLAFNRFQGLIPNSMGEMVNLEILDLSHNNLSGDIPKILSTLRYLKQFNVSFNGLSGEIPSGGPFEKFTSESFMSNNALCGAQRFHVPPCSQISPPKMRGKKVPVVLLVLLSLGLVVSAATSFVIFVCVRYKKKYGIHVPRMTDSSSVAIQERFTYDQIAYATNGFNESNLVGKGSFRSVYKGTLDEGRIVAVKVFKAEVQQVLKSFHQECEVLRNLRHRNITKVITSCSTSDFKALILEFMPKGSLDMWLYSHNYCLDIMQRLNIMIDIAYALQYLHNGYLTPVVHCDLKPSNILLDQDMVAHVSDFGISKFLGKEESITYTQTIATLGYVAPEFGSEGLVSPKCDVYSYGIVMMELFTRKKPSNEMFCGSLTLRSWVSDSMLSRLTHVIDTNSLSVDEEHYTQQMECLRLIMEVALNCTKESPRERSNITDALAMLRKIKIKLQTCDTQG